ncbi:hypothetical protein IWX64_001180 [Arthrobacter sp. CAN_A212]
MGFVQSGSNDAGMGPTIDCQYPVSDWMYDSTAAGSFD